MTNANLTPHIACAPEDFAKTVLMPGDPLRAKFIAETYLTDRELVNNVRGVQGYTGYFEGKRVSVMASGMGMPAMGIYSYELFHMFGVEQHHPRGLGRGDRPVAAAVRPGARAGRVHGLAPTPAQFAARGRHVRADRGLRRC